MLASLDRKLLRDIGRMKGQTVAVSLVMACGLMMMITTRSLTATLEGTRDAYYQTNRMADVFGYVKRAPLALADRLAEALAEITNDQRTAILLYDVEGFDYQEIADMTGVSLGTVKSRIHRGRLALRDLLADQMESLRG